MDIEQKNNQFILSINGVLLPNKLMLSHALDSDKYISTFLDEAKKLTLEEKKGLFNTLKDSDFFKITFEELNYPTYPNSLYNILNPGQAVIQGQAVLSPIGIQVFSSEFEKLTALSNDFNSLFNDSLNDKKVLEIKEMFPNSRSVKSLREFLMKECVSICDDNIELPIIVNEILVLFKYLRETLFVPFGIPHDFHVVTYGRYFFDSSREYYKKLYETHPHLGVLDEEIAKRLKTFLSPKGIVSTAVLGDLWEELQNYIYGFIYDRYKILIPKPLLYTVQRTSADADDRLDLFEKMSNFKFNERCLLYVDTIPNQLKDQLRNKNVKEIFKKGNLGEIDAATSSQVDATDYNDILNAVVGGTQRSINIGEFEFSWKLDGHPEHPIEVRLNNQSLMRLARKSGVQEIANLLGCTPGRGDCTNVYSCKLNTKYKDVEKQARARESTNNPTPLPVWELITSESLKKYSLKIKNHITHTVLAAKQIGDLTGLIALELLTDTAVPPHLILHPLTPVISTGDLLCSSGGGEMVRLYNRPNGRTDFYIPPFLEEDSDNGIYYRFLRMYNHFHSDAFKELEKTLKDFIRPELKDELHGLSYIIATLINEFEDRIKKHRKDLSQLKLLEVEIVMQTQHGDTPLLEKLKETFRLNLLKIVPSVNPTPNELDKLIFGENNEDNEHVRYDDSFNEVLPQRPSKAISIPKLSEKDIQELGLNSTEQGVSFRGIIHPLGKTTGVNEGDTMMFTNGQELVVDPKNIDILTKFYTKSDEVQQTNKKSPTVLIIESIVCGVPMYNVDDHTKKVTNKNKPVLVPEYPYNMSLNDFDFIDFLPRVIRHNSLASTGYFTRWNRPENLSRNKQAAEDLDQIQKETTYKYILHSLFILAKRHLPEGPEKNIYYTIIELFIDQLNLIFDDIVVYTNIIPYLIDIIQNTTIPFPYDSLLNSNRGTLVKYLQVVYNDRKILMMIHENQEPRSPQKITLDLYNTSLFRTTKTPQTLFPRRGFQFFKPKCSGHVEQKLDELINRLERLNKGGKLYNITKKYKNIPNNKTSKYKHPIRRTRRVRPQIPSIIRSHRRTNKIPFAKV